MIIVGSKALNLYFPQVKREIKDVDVIGYNDDIQYLIGLLKPKEIKETKNLT